MRRRPKRFIWVLQPDQNWPTKLELIIVTLSIPKTTVINHNSRLPFFGNGKMFVAKPIVKAEKNITNLASFAKGVEIKYWEHILDITTQTLIFISDKSLDKYLVRLDIANIKGKIRRLKASK